MNAFYTRKIDELGRIVLPLEARLALDLVEGAEVDIVIDTDSLVLTPHKARCRLCGSDRELTEVPALKVSICASCRAKL